MDEDEEGEKEEMIKNFYKKSIFDRLIKVRLFVHIAQVSMLGKTFFYNFFTKKLDFFL